MATKLIDKTEKQELPVATVQEQKPEMAEPFVPPEHLEQSVDAVALDSAAEMLLGMMEERAAFLILQTCEQQQLRPWMYVVGILRRSLDTGEHTQPNIDPMWRTWGAWHTKVLQDSTCGICGKLFTPRWQGQLYDTNECGAVASRRNLDAARADSARTVLPGVGDEAPEQCKSTIGRSDVGGVPTIEDAISDAQNALSAAIEHTSLGGVGQVA